MEKLIELLNEYEYFKELKEVPEEEKDLFVQKFFWHESYGVLNSYGCEDYEILKRKFCYMYAISKEYGFIKWLVENDKIDFDKCGLNVRHYLSYNKRYDKGIVMAENYDNDTFVVKEFYSPYEQLLMLLAISDTPIEDLVSYLK